MDWWVLTTIPDLGDTIDLWHLTFSIQLSVHSSDIEFCFREIGMFLAEGVVTILSLFAKFLKLTPSWEIDAAKGNIIVTII